MHVGVLQGNLVQKDAKAAYKFSAAIKGLKKCTVWKIAAEPQLQEEHLELEQEVLWTPS